MAHAPRHDPRSALRDFQLSFTAHLRDPRHKRPPAGLGADARLYVDIIASTMEAQVQSCFPVTQAVLGKRRWRRLVRAFLAHHDCHTPYFHELPDEFLFYLTCERSPDGRDPPFLTELAHYEWSELALAIDAWPLATGFDPEGDIATGIPYLNPVLAVTDYRYPVHRIGPRFRPAQPEPAPVHLLAFRDLEYEVHFMTINPVTLTLLSVLFEQRLSGAEAVQAVVSQIPDADRPAACAGGLALLQELRARHAILGVATP